MIWIMVVAALVVAVWIYLIFPSKGSPEARKPFTGRSFAHRGLYELDSPFRKTRCRLSGGRWKPDTARSWTCR